MRPPNRARIILLAIVLLVVLGVAAVIQMQPTRRDGGAAPGLLAQYVRADDGAYAWERVTQRPLGQGVAVHELRLTSQVWQGITWQHALRVFLPAAPAQGSTLVLLIVVGGSGGDDDEMQLGTLLASSIGAPVAVLHNIPNQPLLGGLREDALIAETFVRFLDTGDRTWPLLLPMVKSAVRAMDAVQAFLHAETGAAPGGFVVTGASKRGWTAWLTAAVDARVKAIAPMVYDNLDLSRQMQHQLEAWGDFSEQIADYTRRDLPQLLIDEQGAELVALVDPFAYRAQLTMPKLIIVGTNDRYWPLGALSLYYDGLPGAKHIFYAPNGGHDLDEGEADAVADVMAFFRSVDGRLAFPQLAWQYTEVDGRTTLTITSDSAPVAVRAWTTTAPTTDFRDARWQDAPMTQDGASYTYTLAAPAEGHTALFGEAVYLLDGFPLRLSTTVRIVP